MQCIGELAEPIHSNIFSWKHNLLTQEKSKTQNLKPVPTQWVNWPSTIYSEVKWCTHLLNFNQLGEKLLFQENSSRHTRKCNFKNRSWKWLELIQTNLWHIIGSFWNCSISHPINFKVKNSFLFSFALFCRTSEDICKILSWCKL